VIQMCRSCCKKNRKFSFLYVKVSDRFVCRWFSVGGYCAAAMAVHSKTGSLADQCGAHGVDPTGCRDALAWSRFRPFFSADDRRGEYVRSSV